jgi:hypothetical protein
MCTLLELPEAAIFDLLLACSASIEASLDSMRLPSARITLANDNRIVLADCLLEVLAGDFLDLSVVCVRYFDMAATNKIHAKNTRLNLCSHSK